jgi:hypothetical protein
MKEAYKASDGRKIEGRRVLVDVERGRTVEGWCVLGMEAEGRAYMHLVVLLEGHKGWPGVA